MEENKAVNTTEEDNLDPARFVKQARKSRKIRQGRKKQSTIRKTVRFFMTVLLLFLLIYISKMPQWYLPKDAFTKANTNVINIQNNSIVKPYRIMALLKSRGVPHVPIYLMRTKNIEKDIKTLTPVKDVYIRRYAFPARLNIIVKERNPVLSVYLNEKSPVMGAFADDGTFIGKEFMPLSPNIKTIKVLASPNGDFGYTKWNLENINELQKIVTYIETYAKEPVEYIDMRNPADVYVKVKTVNIRLGKLDGTLYERLKRISSILPQVKLIKSKVQYIDISWEKVNYIKLSK